MPKKDKQPVQEPTDMDDKENEHPSTSRTSKFKEGTMNSTNSINAPPDELWKGLEIDDMIDRFHEESLSEPAFSAATPVVRATNTTTVAQRRPAVSRLASWASDVQTPRRGVKITPEPSNAPVPATEGHFSRFSRAVSSWFNGAGVSFSALGKRKAGSEMAERRVEKTAVEKPDDVKELEERYKQMKEQGLFSPTIIGPRPVATRRQPSGIAASVPATPTPNTLSLTPVPRTPALYKTPSKRDLHKQRKLSKRVSDLEHKLQEARKELTLVLGPDNPNSVPPVPTLPPADLPPTPQTEPSISATDMSPYPEIEPPNSASKTEMISLGKVVKKRKALREGDSDADYKPVAADTDTHADTNTNYSRASDSEGSYTKRTKITPPKKLVRKKSARLSRKRSTVRVEKEHVITVKPDGIAVPDVPHIPQGVSGNRVPMSGDDGYGGFEHEMF
ncbi:hypothetical protein BU23DRAFT_560750 [Bimuria novae-zelandiae CBS 107.79]|uniref:Uncharacterized protein n=1 Tax=Bimuria novae-zelandiae CBS 107.79 TaxID=1447943 RepID=A0A6A5UMJ7_9PLEO|nr:hypothetical protein BU23DRAFT_560750 [Bimuria novae-zelandiae CBS 107.79]